MAKNVEGRVAPVKRRLRLKLIALVVGCMFSVGGQAQYIVNDPPTWLESFLDQYQGLVQDGKEIYQWGEEKLHWAKEVQQWVATAQYWQSKLIRLKSLIRTMGLPDGVPLTRVDDDYLVADKCGTELTFDLKGLMKVVKMNLPDSMSPKDTASQQAEICAYIQMLKNKKFNESIDFSNITIAELNQQLAMIDLRRNSSETEGNMSASMYDAMALLNQSAILAQEWETRMASYDAYIAIMEERQNMLAREALKGKSDNPLGTVVKNLALKAALDIN